MDGGENWHVASCGGGTQDKPIINRLMLRFRPIAPKPANAGSLPDRLALDKKNTFTTTKRVKRKYVRVRKGNNNRKNRSCRGDGHVGLSTASMTFQFVPEKIVSNGNPVGGSWSNLDLTSVKLTVDDTQESPVLQNAVTDNMDTGKSSDRTLNKPPMTVVETFVTVECVTESCMDAQWLGCTDTEKIKNLEGDTCPGFISDGEGKVEWLNEEYKRMVKRRLGLEDTPKKVKVWLVMKEKLSAVQNGFTCQARVQYTWQNEKCSKLVPCDVWRMDGGGFAWRLDTKTALSLSI